MPLSPKKTINPHFEVRDEDEIAGYVLSRLIVSCINDKQLIDRLTRYEAERAYVFLHSETGSENEKGWNENTRIDDNGYSLVSKYLADEFRIDITADRIPLVDYVELVSPLHEEPVQTGQPHHSQRLCRDQNGRNGTSCSANASG